MTRPPPFFDIVADRDRRRFGSGFDRDEGVGVQQQRVGADVGEDHAVIGARAPRASAGKSRAATWAGW